jgi:hypothetical protein
MKFRSILLSAVLVVLASSSRGQTVTQQPTNQTVTVGQTATFTIAISDPTCTVMWQRNGSNVRSGADLLSYTTAPTTLADNGAKFGTVVYNCKTAANAHSAVAGLIVAKAVTLNVTGSLKFDDQTVVYVGAIVAQQDNAGTWVDAGAINIDANGLFSGYLIVNPALVDAAGNLEITLGITAPPLWVKQTFVPAQFLQGSTGLTITWVLFKKAPTVTKAGSFELTP